MNTSLTRRAALSMGVGMLAPDNGDIQHEHTTDSFHG